MSKWRDTLEALYDHLYTTVGDRYGFCVYCGIPAESLDHVPPLSLTNMLNDRAKEKLDFLKLPSCGECNSVLNDSPILSVSERRGKVRAHYKKKYRSALNMPKWDEDELAELDPCMADEIRQASKRAEWVKARITWMPPKDIDDLSADDA